MNLNSTRKNIGKCQIEAFLWNSFFFYLSHLLFSSEHPTYQLMRKLKKKGPTRTSSVPFSSVAKSCITLCDPMNHSMPGLPVHHQLSEFTQSHVHWVGDAIEPSHPLLSPSPGTPNPSQHQSLFLWVSSSHEMAKVLEFQFSISLSNEHPGLISYRMDWLDLLAVQGTLKSLLQHHSSKASIPQPSAFFTVQLTSIRDHWKNYSLD